MDKQVKKEFKKIASKDPDNYYSTNFLKSKGFKRYKCEKCSTHFWSLKKRNVCGDPGCAGGFTFLEDNPCKKSLSYKQVWEEFSKHMKKRGYTPIERYPVVARWRDDTDFVQASIYNFQPYVVNGEVDAPANPLIVPQFSLRFNDIDNVGVTMSHNTGFVMIGQHAFMNEKDWDQNKYFKDLFEFFTLILGIPEEELILHEDAWAGGGNYGPCMEIFCKGVELANQVYMLYENTEKGKKDLKLKVLDMGMGHERIAWFSQGKGTSYDAIFPNVMEKLYKKTGIEYDEEFMKRYVKYASYLNVDEVDDIEKAWDSVSKNLKIDKNELKEKLLPLRALYSVAEHSRSLLFALSDGALPSNVKGGYNLRVILRRALSFIDQYKWDVSLGEICEWHAEYLRGLFPELKDNIEHVKKILSVEEKKYNENKKRGEKLVKKIVKENPSVEKIIELYDSNGVSPDYIKEVAKKENVDIKIPENFYSLVSERHEKKEEKKEKTRTFDFKVPETVILYYKHYDLLDFKAEVIKIKKIDDYYYVVLNKTAFYPTSGGQQHDTGFINEDEVIDVIKEGKVVIHKLKSCSFKEKDVVNGKVDFDRRMILSQHHTGTHILTGSTNRILGSHVWQAGAAKTIEKGRLDITHYEQLSEKELKDIEELANKIVSENRPVYSSFLSRDKAEAEYSIRIYQGGAVPGKELRIVNIEGFDVEACGGTHVPVTGDVGSIKILKTSKLQDGVVRIEFVAGNVSESLKEKEKNLMKEISKLLECEINQIPGRANELFNKWKKAKKGKLEEFKLESEEVSKGDVLKEASIVLKTQPEHVLKTIERFLGDIHGKEKKKK